MKLATHHQTACWLVISALLLSSLIPGGPIENRDFSHIHPIILGAFNVFLTVLDMGSFVLAYFAWQRQRWALQAAFVAAIAFFAVYAVDLAQLFPRSPTPMSFALALIEVLGMSVAVPLMFSSRRALHEASRLAGELRSSTIRYPLRMALLVIGVAVIWFATDAAMSGASSVLISGRGAAS